MVVIWVNFGLYYYFKIQISNKTIRTNAHNINNAKLVDNNRQVLTEESSSRNWVCVMSVNCYGGVSCVEIDGKMHLLRVTLNGRHVSEKRSVALCIRLDTPMFLADECQTANVSAVLAKRIRIS